MEKHQRNCAMVSQTIEQSDGWNRFIDELQEQILPIYRNHEMTFDPWGIHGRIHICRSVLFAEWMTRFYRKRSSAEMDFYAIRVATAMHDSGRQANGVDLWQKDSASLCYSYVESHSPHPGDSEYARYVASLIDKGKTGDACKWVVYDADVLEIMRPSCGHGGIGGFRRECLHFAGAEDLLVGGLADSHGIREAFIQEAWRWIADTESVKPKLFASSAYMTDLLEKLHREKRHYPMLSSLV
jgi:hypothetical protein